MERYAVVDLASRELSELASTLRAYSEAELADLLRAAGFGEPERLASLGAEPPDAESGLYALVARVA